MKTVREHTFALMGGMWMRSRQLRRMFQISNFLVRFRYLEFQLRRHLRAVLCSLLIVRSGRIELASFTGTSRNQPRRFSPVHIQGLNMDRGGDVFLFVVRDSASARRRFRFVEA